jgi:hypothetical protein
LCDAYTQWQEWYVVYHSHFHNHCLFFSLKTNYILKKVSTSKNGAETILRYTTNEFATSKFKDFIVVIENDSCKILLPDNLEEFLK